MAKREILFVVDYQQDFVHPEGALHVSSIDDRYNLYMTAFINMARLNGNAVFQSQDWHFAGDPELQRNGGPWPDHCMADSLGARLVCPNPIGNGYINRNGNLAENVWVSSTQVPDTIIRKGSYSPWDNGVLEEGLKIIAPDRIIVVGLATEYCVRAFVLGALQRKYEVVLFPEGLRSVDEKDGQEAYREMVAAGALDAGNPEVTRMLNQQLPPSNLPSWLN